MNIQDTLLELKKEGGVLSIDAAKAIESLLEERQNLVNERNELWFEIEEMLDRAKSKTKVSA